MEIILWIVMGAIAGWIASIIMKTNDQQDVFMNIIVGVVGGILGGWGATFLGINGLTGFNFYSLFISVIGSIFLIFIVKVFNRSE